MNKQGKKGKNKKNKKNIKKEPKSQPIDEEGALATRASRSNSISQQKEEEFENMIEEFKQRLEEVNNHSLRMSKLRPNYHPEWIEALKGKLKFYSSHQPKEKDSASESAVPCAGF